MGTQMQPNEATNAPSTRRRLPLIAAGSELSGKSPRGFERAVKQCRTGDASHRALIHTGCALATRALQLCLPPRARSQGRLGLETAIRWTQGQTTYREARNVRASLFAASKATESDVLLAVEQGIPKKSTASALDAHANRVVRRYVGLGVHHALTTVVLCLDSIADPKQLLGLPSELAGAVAYRDVGFGAARDDKLREQAIEQAKWESQSLAANEDEAIGTLALQLFHEYLGVHWSALALAQQMYAEEFIRWLFPDAGVTPLIR